MNKSALAAAAFCTLVVILSLFGGPTAADTPTTQQRIANNDKLIGEILSAFPGQVDIYINGKMDQPELSKAKIVKWVEIAGNPFFVILTNDGSTVYVNPSQIAMIRPTK